MTLRLILVTAPEDAKDRLLDKIAGIGAVDTWVEPATSVPGEEDEEAEPSICLHVLADDTSRQELLDGIQSTLGPSEGWRITIVPVDTTVPYPDEEEEDEEDEEETEEDEAERKKKETGPGGRTREEIYNGVWSQAQTNRNYIVFVILSTVVAAFGMIEDNVPVVVGAMVIAPLLGPNLAFAVGVALGDGKLMGRAARAIVVGIALALVLSLGIGLFMPVDLGSHELLARAEVGFDGMAVGLASGAAAALSLVTGISSALVGVMVAVALLPPTAAIGLFLGAGHGELALGAAILLAVNIVCVNIAAQVVMLTRGITPRTWFEKRRARRASVINAAISAALLLILAVLLWLRSRVGS